LKSGRKENISFFSVHANAIYYVFGKDATNGSTKTVETKIAEEVETKTIEPKIEEKNVANKVSTNKTKQQNVMTVDTISVVV
jgi:hypothetical protein